MVSGHGFYIAPQRKMEMAQAHDLHKMQIAQGQDLHKMKIAQEHIHKAQGLISDLNIPITSPLAKFIGLGKKIP